jgi:2-C-methyl-D-erythritol 4-phosphate cytidylyltransferase / 2-C-methyl-D-erythritol 2,4-cyclodiphosphate synthase
MKTIAIIVAGGTGTRAIVGSRVGQVSEPKQFRLLGGRPMIDRAITPFLDHPRVDAVLVVINGDWMDRYHSVVGEREGLLAPVPGGATRQASVCAGLEAVAPISPDKVLIHDAARPFVSATLIDRTLDGLDHSTGAIPAFPVTDTLKRSKGDGLIAETVDRHNLFAAQTPQGFGFAEILNAHRRARSLDSEFTDDASIAEWAGLPVALVTGDPANGKMTTPEDFEMAEMLLARHAPHPETRVGTGFDVHRFAPGGAVTLCGITIPHDFGLLGHSDADVGLHALTDALLGAIGDGDIGSHFPPSDPQWKAAASDQFLRHAAGLVARRGGAIVNVDVTLICESPKIGRHREAMRARIADILAITVERVSVKATTSEGLGFTGRREGIAAQAVATISVSSAERS